MFNVFQSFLHNGARRLIILLWIYPPSVAKCVQSTPGDSKQAKRPSMCDHARLCESKWLQKDHMRPAEVKWDKSETKWDQVRRPFETKQETLNMILLDSCIFSTLSLCFAILHEFTRFPINFTGCLINFILINFPVPMVPQVWPSASNHHQVTQSQTSSHSC